MSWQTFPCQATAHYRETAFVTLRRYARAQRRKLADIAEEILGAIEQVNGLRSQTTLPGLTG